jgi:RNA polymerase sigma factor (sigma-70 family)
VNEPATGRPTIEGIGTRGRDSADDERGRDGLWLNKIVANVALGRLRRRHPEALVSIDDLEREPADSGAEQPLMAAVRRERRGDILYALLALPHAQRAALTLREYQGLSYDEIGDLLGLNRDAMAALLYRARASFREAYEGLTARSEPVSCPDLAPLISAMLDDELESGTWESVDGHVATCRRCQCELRQLRRSRRLYRTVPLLVPPTGWSWAATLEAASAGGAAGIAGAAGAASLVTTGAGLAPVVAAPVLVGMTGILATLGGAVTAKVVGTAVAAGLTVAVALTGLAEVRPPSEIIMVESVSGEAPPAAEIANGSGLFSPAEEGAANFASTVAVASAPTSTQDAAAQAPTPPPPGASTAAARMRPADADDRTERSAQQANAAPPAAPDSTVASQPDPETTPAQPVAAAPRRAVLRPRPHLQRRRSAQR